MKAPETIVLQHSAAIADPPSSGMAESNLARLAGSLFDPTGAIHFFRKECSMEAYIHIPPVSARQASTDQQVTNLRTFPQCFVGKTAAEIQQAIDGLKNMDLCLLFSPADIKRAWYAHASAISVLQVMLEGTRGTRA